MLAGALGDALQGIDQDRGNLAQVFEIPEARVGNEQGQRQQRKKQQAGERGGAGLEKRGRLMFHQRRDVKREP